MKRRKNSDQTNKYERDREIHHINKTMHVLLFTVNKDNWPMRRVCESHDHHDAKWTFTSQDHQLTTISPILQAYFLYSVNIYKCDM